MKEIWKRRKRIETERGEGWQLKRFFLEFLGKPIGQIKHYFYKKSLSSCVFYLGQIIRHSCGSLKVFELSPREQQQDLVFLEGVQFNIVIKNEFIIAFYLLQFIYNTKRTKLLTPPNVNLTIYLILGLD
jgi:hypothetical protein